MKKTKKENLIWITSTFVLLVFCMIFVGIQTANNFNDDNQIDIGGEFTINQKDLIAFSEQFNSEPFELCNIETKKCEWVQVEVGE